MSKPAKINGETDDAEMLNSIIAENNVSSVKFTWYAVVEMAKVFRKQ